MNLKIVLGIILPTFVIILLTVLSSLNVGFSFEKKIVKELTLSNIFIDGELNKRITLGEINFKNEYFLPKRYDLPALYVCIIDSEGEKFPQDVGTVIYSEGDQSYGQDNYLDSYYYNSRSTSTNVEISSGKEKSVKIYLSPNNPYVYDSYDSYGNLTKTKRDLIVEKYAGYDSLILIEKSDDKSYYFSCSSAPTRDLEKGIKIAIKP